MAVKTTRDGKLWILDREAKGWEEVGKLSSEELKKIMGQTSVFRSDEERARADIAAQFGIPESMMENKSVAEALDYVLAFSGSSQHESFREDSPWKALDHYRKDWEMVEINEGFLFELRDALIEIVGYTSVAFRLDKFQNPQGQKLVKVFKGVNLTPKGAVLFLEAHMTHLGVALVGSTGKVWEGDSALLIRIDFSAPIRLQPEILSVTAEQACPEPDLTLYCNRPSCGFYVQVPETAAPARTQDGCPDCGAKELRYESCLSNGQPLKDYDSAKITILPPDPSEESKHWIDKLAKSRNPHGTAWTNTSGTPSRIYSLWSHTAEPDH